jgi:hypothetical protein
MDSKKVGMFIELAGKSPATKFTVGNEEQRKLGAQLLLSEVLEYVIKGLGITPVVDGVEIKNPDGLKYVASNDPDPVEMLDGLADTGYTMFWNALTFGIPLEKAFDLVCDNNLEKFVRLNNWQGGSRELATTEWNCGCEVTWPEEVATVVAIKVGEDYYAVGKDERGKVRKPSSFKPLDLQCLLK